MTTRSARLYALLGAVLGAFFLAWWMETQRADAQGFAVVRPGEVPLSTFANLGTGSCLEEPSQLCHLTDSGSCDVDDAGTDAFCRYDPLSSDWVEVSSGGNGGVLNFDVIVVVDGTADCSGLQTSFRPFMDGTDTDRRVLVTGENSLSPTTAADMDSVTGGAEDYNRCVALSPSTTFVNDYPNYDATARIQSPAMLHIHWDNVTWWFDDPTQPLSEFLFEWGGFYRRGVATSSVSTTSMDDGGRIDAALTMTGRLSLRDPGFPHSTSGVQGTLPSLPVSQYAQPTTRVWWMTSGVTRMDASNLSLSITGRGPTNDWDDMCFVAHTGWNNVYGYLYTHSCGANETYYGNNVGHIMSGENEAGVHGMIVGPLVAGKVPVSPDCTTGNCQGMATGTGSPDMYSRVLEGFTHSTYATRDGAGTFYGTYFERGSAQVAAIVGIGAGVCEASDAIPYRTCTYDSECDGDCIVYGACDDASTTPGLRCTVATEAADCGAADRCLIPDFFPVRFYGGSSNVGNVNMDGWSLGPAATKEPESNDEKALLRIDGMLVERETNLGGSSTAEGFLGYHPDADLIVDAEKAVFRDERAWNVESYPRLIAPSRDARPTATRRAYLTDGYGGHPFDGDLGPELRQYYNDHYVSTGNVVTIPPPRPGTWVFTPDPLAGARPVLWVCHDETPPTDSQVHDCDNVGDPLVVHKAVFDQGWDDVLVRALYPAQIFSGNTRPWLGFLRCGTVATNDVGDTQDSLAGVAECWTRDRVNVIVGEQGTCTVDPTIWCDVDGDCPSGTCVVSMGNANAFNAYTADGAGGRFNYRLVGTKINTASSGVQLGGRLRGPAASLADKVAPLTYIADASLSQMQHEGLFPQIGGAATNYNDRMIGDLRMSTFEGDWSFTYTTAFAVGSTAFGYCRDGAKYPFDTCVGATFNWWSGGNPFLLASFRGAGLKVTGDFVGTAVQMGSRPNCAEPFYAPNIFRGSVVQEADSGFSLFSPPGGSNCDAQNLTIMDAQAVNTSIVENPAQNFIAWNNGNDLLLGEGFGWEGPGAAAFPLAACHPGGGQGHREGTLTRHVLHPAVTTAIDLSSPVDGTGLCWNWTTRVLDTCGADGTGLTMTQDTMLLSMEIVLNEEVATNQACEVEVLKNNLTPAGGDGNDTANCAENGTDPDPVLGDATLFGDGDVYRVSYLDHLAEDDVWSLRVRDFSATDPARCQDGSNCVCDDFVASVSVWTMPASAGF